MYFKVFKYNFFKVDIGNTLMFVKDPANLICQFKRFAHILASRAATYVISAKHLSDKRYMDNC